MKSFSSIITVVMLAMIALTSHMATASSDEKPHFMEVGPERDLGIVLANCDNYCSISNDNEYRVCYYGIPLISKPQELCWENTPIRNFVANSLRIVGRVECGRCP